MTWNNRIVKSKFVTTDDGKELESPEFHFSIREVYYDEKGEPEGWTGDSISLIGDNAEELKSKYEFIAEAFKAPILEQVGDKLVEIK